ncbi:hypothetical protein [Streptomyces sp. NBRC 110028]|uniref:hypothetical protein n=1 Tax=Streptomyces sp. NBRC 110028 TaxID=1621260 RepID=UPI000AC53E2D|nr:hypothetical protein [Streptomyces sp. NBRC 110028]
MELRILAPTGALGAGFDADALARGLAVRDRRGEGHGLNAEQLGAEGVHRLAGCG